MEMNEMFGVFGGVRVDWNALKYTLNYTFFDRTALIDFVSVQSTC